MDTRETRATLTAAPDLPPELVDGLLRLCQGDFSYRLPRSGTRDSADTAAFFVNTIAEELERILRTTQEQERRLEDTVERLSQILLRMAGGDFSAQVERDYAGDAVDVLAYLVNNTVKELGNFVALAQRKAEEDRQRLEALVRERTRELDQLATSDMLTGTFNRRRIVELGEQEIARAGRYNQPLCMAMLDLDHFKSINDTHGHAVGDAALRLAADAIKGRVRTYDHVGRYGGEEFVIITPNTAMDGAATLAEAVRDAVARSGLKASGKPVPVTASIGVAQWQRDETLDQILRRADAALYGAKETGRNRVTLAEIPNLPTG
jgi:diguanylate cyclase (GGDEF)-like protein